MILTALLTGILDGLVVNELKNTIFVIVTALVPGILCGLVMNELKKKTI